MAEVDVVQLLCSGKKDLIWFENNLQALIPQYDNRFVAIHGERIIDSDSHLPGLFEKLKLSGIETSGVLIKFISRIKMIL